MAPPLFLIIGSTVSQQHSVERFLKWPPTLYMDHFALFRTITLPRKHFLNMMFPDVKTAFPGEGLSCHFSKPWVHLNKKMQNLPRYEQAPIQHNELLWFLMDVQSFIIIKLHYVPSLVKQTGFLNTTTNTSVH